MAAPSTRIGQLGSLLSDAMYNATFSINVTRYTHTHEMPCTKLYLILGERTRVSGYMDGIAFGLFRYLPSLSK